MTMETQSPSASLPPNIQSPSAPPPPETPGPSASPFPEKEDGEVFNWLTGLLAGFLVISLAINIYLVVKIWKPDLHTPDDTRGVINSTFQADSNVDGSAEELDNIPNQEQRKKEVGGGET
nr:uncharacterized protein LOC131777435 [Pocillopora verrucosa]